MIQVRNLEKMYTPKKAPKCKAVNGISFDLPDTGLVYILGKSGCGKSTLLNLLGGLDRPTGGEIIVDGKSMKDFSEKELDTFRNEYVGFVFQEYNLLDRSSVASNVALAAELQGKKADRNEIEELLRSLELTDEKGDTLYDRHIGELSGGQKQRVAIARTLIKHPRLILADEPTGALDSETGAKLYELLKTLSKDNLIVVVTHDEESAKTYGDRIIRLSDGTVQSDTVLVEEAYSKPKETAQSPKNKLPFRRVLTMGLSGFCYKKVRLVLSVLLSVVSFSVFCFSLVAATVDEFEAELKTAYDNHLKTAFIMPDNHFKEEYIPYKNTTIYISPNTYSHDFSEKQQAVFDEYGCKLLPVVSYAAGEGRFKPILIRQFLATEPETKEERFNPFYYYSRMIELLEVSPETGEEDALLSPDRRLTVPCRLPETYDEIAITDYQAEIFLRYGLKDEETVYEINSVNDLIGKPIQGLTIVGIYETAEDMREFQKKYDVPNTGTLPPGWSEDLYMDQVDSYLPVYMKGYHPMLYALVKSGFMAAKNESASEMYYFKLSGNVNKDRQLFADLGYQEKKIGQLYGGDTYEYSVQFSAELLTPFSGARTETMYGIVTDPEFTKIAMYVGIGLSVFSALLFMNFLFVSFDARKREIGILRALGAHRSDVVKICLVESLALALVGFLLTLAVVGGFCLGWNTSMHFSIFLLGPIPFFSLLLLCFGVATFASVIPVIKTTKRRPIDIINDRK